MPVISAEIGEAFQFYDDRYDRLGNWVLSPGKKQFLGNPHDRACRFCKRTAPEVTFRMLAHAAPEAIGNKTLFTYYECDDCNRFFGTGIEDEFGRWSKPMRLLNRIKGKSGVPTVKRTDGGWRIEGAPDGLRVDHREEDPAFEDDQQTRELTFRLVRDSFTPMAVLKAFVKVGISLLPESEIPNVEMAIKWIREPDHSAMSMPDWPVLRTFMPGAYRSDTVSLWTFRRKHNDLNVPYAFVVLGFGNEQFQVFIPSPERDSQLHGKTLNLFRFPSIYDIDPAQTGTPFISRLNLTGTSVVKNEVVEVVLSYEQSLPIG